MSVIKDPYYSKYLTLDELLVDTIPDMFRYMPEIDEALEILANLLLSEEFERGDTADPDEEVSILNVIYRKSTFNTYTVTVRKPWTQIFSAMEPADLDDSPYVTGETKLLAYSGLGRGILRRRALRF